MHRQRNIELSWSEPGGATVARTFATPFRIGRTDDCDICLTERTVSRRHAEVYPAGPAWYVRDLGSSNGTFVDGVRINDAHLPGEGTIRLGSDGPHLRFCIEAPNVETSNKAVTEQTAIAPLPAFQTGGANANAGHSTGRPAKVEAAVSLADPYPEAENGGRPSLGLEDVARRYFDDHEPEGVGEHTRMIRAAYRRRATEQAAVEEARGYRRRRLFGGMAALFFLLLATSTGTAIYLYLQLEKTRQVAIDLFYDIKSTQVALAKLEDRLGAHDSAEMRQELAEYRTRVAAMGQRYENYIEDLRTFELGTSREDRLILRMARVFGECDLNVPEPFKAEVRAYIAKWKATGRLEQAMRRLDREGYTPLIYRTLTEQGLPPQFLYVALQESGFRPTAVGPETAYGHAKGMWQFIPSTAKHYGLALGPLQHAADFDNDDERFNPVAATKAAARLLRDLYQTEAQASGLLVLASYNWGAGNVLKRIRTMPKNPRERNFWKLLESHKIPQETYDYVFYIFAAAVIAEDPKLFGFKFENPLAGLDGDHQPLSGIS